MEDGRTDREQFGPETRWECVRSDTHDPRPWLADAPVCALLKNHHIAHIGRMWARSPFEVIRSEASGTFALVGLEGGGATLVDGKWRTLSTGDICLLPAFAPTGIRATSKQVWSFGWVRYHESRDTSPILSTNSPVIHQGEVHTLSHAIAGLFRETSGTQGDAGASHHWVELIHGFVVRAARPYQGDDRLWRVWQEVEKDLARDWQLDDLAAIGNISTEHLRRLAQKQLGRSPIQQVAYLKMRQAAALLTATDGKIESIGRRVGYENPFTFSNAFKRWTGRRPTDFRARHL